MDVSPTTSFFAALRRIALKLDKSSRDLRSKTEERTTSFRLREMQSDDARTLLKLGALLDEAQQLRCIMEKEVLESDGGEFPQFVTACGALHDQHAEDIEKLQVQLEKYGFQRTEDTKGIEAEAVAADTDVLDETEGDKNEGKENREASPSYSALKINLKRLNALRDMRKPQTVQEPGPSQSLDETAMNTSTAFHSPSHPGLDSVEVACRIAKDLDQKDDVVKTLEFTDSPLVSNKESIVHNISSTSSHRGDQTWTVSAPSYVLQQRMSNPDLKLTEAMSPVAPVRRKSEHSLNHSEQRNHHTRRLLPQPGISISNHAMYAGFTPPIPKSSHHARRSNKEKEHRPTSSQTSIVSNSLASLAALASELETSSSKQQERRKQGQIQRISSSPANLGGKALKQALQQIQAPMSSSNTGALASPSLQTLQSYQSMERHELKPVALVSGQSKGVSGGRNSPSYFEQLGKAKLEADLSMLQNSFTLSEHLDTSVTVNQPSPLKQIAQVSDDEYQTSAAYLKRQVPLSYLNDVISLINTHIATERQTMRVGYLSLSELQNELGLGSKATIIQLLLIKLHRIKRNGSCPTSEIMYSVC